MSLEKGEFTVNWNIDLLMDYINKRNRYGKKAIRPQAVERKD